MKAFSPILGLALLILFPLPAGSSPPIEWRTHEESIGQEYQRGGAAAVHQDGSWTVAWIDFRTGYGSIFVRSFTSQDEPLGPVSFRDRRIRSLPFRCQRGADRRTFPRIDGRWPIAPGMDRPSSRAPGHRGGVGRHEWSHRGPRHGERGRTLCDAAGIADRAFGRSRPGRVDGGRSSSSQGRRAGPHDFPAAGPRELPLGSRRGGHSKRSAARRRRREAGSWPGRATRRIPPRSICALTTATASPLSEPKLVESDPLTIQSEPSIAAVTGGYFVTWTSGYAGRVSLLGRLVDANLDPAAPSIFVSTADETVTPRLPEILPLDDGSLLEVWTAGSAQTARFHARRVLLPGTPSGSIVVVDDPVPPQGQVITPVGLTLVRGSASAARIRLVGWAGRLGPVLPPLDRRGRPCSRPARSRGLERRDRHSGLPGCRDLSRSPRRRRLGGFPLR